MDAAKHFKKIMDMTNKDRVIILTAHYKIEGTVYDCEDCNKDSCVNLTNATVCNISDAYEDECENTSKYDWLHINMESVVAYSFI